MLTCGQLALASSRRTGSGLRDGRACSARPARASVDCQQYVKHARRLPVRAWKGAARLATTQRHICRQGGPRALVARRRAAATPPEGLLRRRYGRQGGQRSEDRRSLARLVNGSTEISRSGRSPYRPASRSTVQVPRLAAFTADLEVLLALTQGAFGRNPSATSGDGRGAPRCWWCRGSARWSRLRGSAGPLRQVYRLEWLDRLAA